jgi:hypothetical protein
VQRVLEKLDGVKKNTKGWTAFCPAHDDRRGRSLSVSSGDDGRVLVHCFVGCAPQDIVAALGLTMADLFPQSEASIRPGSGGWKQRGEGDHFSPSTTATAQHAGLTLDQYAAAKKLDPGRLRAFGLSDAPYYNPHAVKILYRDEAGDEAAVRFRLRLDKGEHGDERFKWRTGSKLCLYGRDHLPVARERGYVVLVEGESDCHTLWSHDEPAIGLPGANNWNESRDAPFLADIPVIYVVIEADQGGDAVMTWLRTSAIRDRVRLIDLGAFKDPSGLYLDDPEHFTDRWEAAKSAATPLTERLTAEAQAERVAAWNECQVLARTTDILSLAADEVAAIGVAGERSAIKLVYLAMVSRLLSRPVSLAVKGPSSGGKSFVVEQTLRLFPDEAYYALTAMSERALAYSGVPLSNKMLVLYEAAGMSGDIASYLIRSLLSEGRVRYETVEKTKEGLRARLIEREGPTGLIVTTTATSLHPENETRLVSITVSDTKEQTRAIFHALASGRDSQPDPVSWHALQRWLELDERRVEIPFADALADLIPPTAVRLRRDFRTVLSFIQAHVLLHRASRERNDTGEIVATLDDYEAIRMLLEPLIAFGVEATIPATIRETVDAVQQLCPNEEDTASVTAIARVLRLDTSTASRRARMAKERGYLVNHETKRGQPAKYAIGEALPEDSQILPERCTVAAMLEGITTPPPSIKTVNPAPALGDPPVPRIEIIGNAPKGCPDPEFCGIHGPCPAHRRTGACPPTVDRETQRAA